MVVLTGVICSWQYLVPRHTDVVLGFKLHMLPLVNREYLRSVICNWRPIDLDNFISSWCDCLLLLCNERIVTLATLIHYLVIKVTSGIFFESHYFILVFLKAPEVLMCRKYDAVADIWSMGIIVYQCLTGKAPFYASNPEALKNIYETSPCLKPKWVSCFVLV